MNLYDLFWEGIYIDIIYLRVFYPIPGSTYQALLPAPHYVVYIYLDGVFFLRLFGSPLLFAFFFFVPVVLRLLQRYIAKSFLPKSWPLYYLSTAVVMNLLSRWVVNQAELYPPENH